MTKFEEWAKSVNDLAETERCKYRFNERELRPFYDDGSSKEDTIRELSKVYAEYE